MARKQFAGHLFGESRKAGTSPTEYSEYSESFRSCRPIFRSASVGQRNGFSVGTVSKILMSFAVDRIGNTLHGTVAHHHAECPCMAAAETVGIAYFVGFAVLHRKTSVFGRDAHIIAVAPAVNANVIRVAKIRLIVCRFVSRRCEILF